MIIITDSSSIENYNKFKLKYERRLFYGYNGPEDGFHKWLDTKQQEFESSNKQGSISLKNGNKMAKRTGNTALLSKQKGSDIVQNEAMRLSNKRLAEITHEEWLGIWKIFEPNKDWHPLRSSNKS